MWTIRWRRQPAMAIWRTRMTSVAVAGWCSASSESRRLWKSDSFSPGRTRMLEASPCLRPLRRTASLPAGVLGPVLFWALFLLAASWASVAMGDLLPGMPGDSIVAGGFWVGGARGGGVWVKWVGFHMETIFGEVVTVCPAKAGTPSLRPAQE